MTVKDEVKLAPNPIKKEGILVLRNDIEIRSIIITDVLGRDAVSNFEVIKQEGENSYTIKPRSAEGLYVLNLSNSAGWQKTIKFSVTR